MSKLRTWIELRLPIFNAYRQHFSQYPIPKNLNIWYVFGVLAILVLLNQLLTGISLAMNYVPSTEGAFASIEYIMRDVDYGWLLRYLHSTGASALFIILYLHIFRGFLYGSYHQPRELVWVFGMLLFLILMAEAFMGYLLPWGQMSYWGAQVITSLLGAIPFIGDDLMLWIRGDYVISGVTLNRFYALHIIGLPLVMLLLVILHLVALHQVGSSNPEGTETRLPKGQGSKDKNEPSFTFHPHYVKQHDIVDSIPLHPYGTVKDLVAIAVFLLLFCSVVFFAPDLAGYFLEPENAIIADPSITPEHITPAWYFTPFYTILRAIPDKLGGAILMGSSISLLFFIPWLDRSKIRSIRYRSALYRWNLFQFSLCFIALGVLGVLPITPCYLWLSRLFCLGYFLFFVVLFIESRRSTVLNHPDK